MGERPLTDAEYDRLADTLNRFHGEGAMNLEQLDGFFAALICGPDRVHPSEYLPETGAAATWLMRRLSRASSSSRTFSIW